MAYRGGASPRFKAGVKQRLCVIRRILAHETPLASDRMRSSYTIQGAYRGLYTNVRDYELHNEDFFTFLDFSATYRVASDKLSFIESRSHHVDFPIIRHVALGENFLSNYSEFQLISSVADQSAFCRDSRDPIDANLAYQRKKISEFIELRRLHDRSSNDNLVQYLLIFFPFAVHPEIDLDRIRGMLRIVARHLWPLVGSFVPNHLLRLLDASDCGPFPNELRAEACSVLLEKLHDEIVFLRAINDARIKCDGDLQRSKYSSVDRAVLMKFYKHLDGDYAASLAHPFRPSAHIQKIYATIIDIYNLISMKSTINKIGLKISYLYNLDRSSVYFLDWGRIIKYIKQYPASTTPVSIFLSILILEPMIVRRFPLETALGMGPGRANRQIFGRASELIRNRQARHIKTFLRKFLTLSGRSRELVYSYLCDKSISDRLYSVFMPNNIHTGEPNDAKVSETRIEILRFAIDNLAGDVSHLKKLLWEESSLLRGFSFAEIFGKGRVHLNSFEMEFEIEQLIDSEFNLSEFMKRASPQVDSLDDISGYFATVLADRLRQYSIFASDYSVDAILSNNLRHGVVEPRIVGAIQAACRDSGDNQAVAAFQSRVASALHRYLSEWLTITADGDVQAMLFRDLRSRFIRTFRNVATVSAGELAEVTVEEVQKMTRAILSNAAAAFRVQVVPEILEVLEQQVVGGSISLALKDRIEVNLNRAFDDVRGWLSVREAEGDIKPFGIIDLARFESALFLNPSMKDIAPQFTAEVRMRDRFQTQDADFIVPGKHFEAVFTVVHNLISNAVKYSGAGSRTELSFRVRRIDDKIVFRVENVVDLSISDVQVEERRQSALQMARMNYREDVFKEGKSGFKKIRRICKRDFGGCEINIPTISSNRARKIFVVEVIVEACRVLQ